MDKPTFVYVPDIDCVKRYMPHYHIENIKKYPHLVWCDTIKDVVDNIHKFDKSGNDFLVSDKMFKYHDMDNTKRMLDWMFDKYGIKNVKTETTT